MNDPYTYGTKTWCMQKRYLLSIGGSTGPSNYKQLPKNNLEVFRRYDILKDKKGWQTICLMNDNDCRNGYEYGIIPTEN